MEQLINKAVTGVQLTGLYPTALLEWNGFEDDNQTWPELKSHFTEAYDLLISSGGGTAAAVGFHGANKATEEDDDSFNSIQASLTNIQMANNVNAQSLQDGVSAISARTQQLEAQLLTTQQQLAAQQQMAMYAPGVMYAPIPAQMPTYPPPTPVTV